MSKTLPRLAAALAFLGIASGQAQETSFRSANYYVFAPPLTASRLMAAFRIAYAQQNPIPIGTVLPWRSVKTGKPSAMQLVSIYNGGYVIEEQSLTKDSTCHVFKLEASAVLADERTSGTKVIFDDDITQPDQQPYVTFCVDPIQTKQATSDAVLQSHGLDRDTITAYRAAYPFGSIMPDVRLIYSRPAVLAGAH